MVTSKGFFKPNTPVLSEKIALQKPISAIQVFQNEDGSSRLGLLSKIGPGMTVERCGEGFNERTVKVRLNGYYYYVFLQDLESQSSGLARAQCA